MFLPLSDEAHRWDRQPPDCQLLAPSVYRSSASVLSVIASDVVVDFAAASSWTRNHGLASLVTAMAIVEGAPQ